MGKELWALREKGTDDGFLVYWEPESASLCMMVYRSQNALPADHILLTQYELVRLEVADD